MAFNTYYLNKIPRKTTDKRLVSLLILNEQPKSRAPACASPAVNKIQRSILTIRILTNQSAILFS